MELDDLLHEIEAEAESAAAVLEPVKRLEDALALPGRNALALVVDGDAGRMADVNSDDASSTAVLDRVLDQVGDGALQCRAIADNLDHLLIRLEAGLITGRDGKGGEVGDDLPRYIDNVDQGSLELMVEALKVEELLGQCRKPCGILQKPHLLGAGGQAVEPRLQDSCAPAAPRWRTAWRGSRPHRYRGRRCDRRVRRALSTR